MEKAAVVAPGERSCSGTLPAARQKMTAVSKKTVAWRGTNGRFNRASNTTTKARPKNVRSWVSWRTKPSFSAAHRQAGEEQPHRELVSTRLSP